jgi:hypothetical protein
LGTLAAAERIADLILPGMTARMWRPRYLTLSAVAAHIAQRIVEQIDKEEMRLSARMAFERLFVSAIGTTRRGRLGGRAQRTSWSEARAPCVA